MTNLNITLPDSLAKKATELAKREQISLDQFVSLAVAEKMLAWLTEGYIAERAKRGDRMKFLRALGKVPPAPPDKQDEL